MSIDDQKLKEILLKGSYVSDKEIERLGGVAKKQNNKVIDLLLSEGLITKDILAQAIAEFFNLNYANLLAHQPSQEVILKIPESIALKHRLILVKEEDKQVIVATSNPDVKKIQPIIKKIFKNKKVLIQYDLDERIESFFINYKGSLSDRFEKIIKGKAQIAPKIISEMLGDALDYKVSDIHIEPQDSDVVIRFRIDGVLHEVGKIPRPYFINILNRIKIQSRMQIDEHFAAQDGVMRYENSRGERVDMRVSIVPIVDGEKVVIRLLSKQAQELTLGDLGLSSFNEEQLIKLAKKPFGMILVTGPTGSGKTTTLYGLLKILNRPEVNIATIEDPVEYKIRGVNHIQVNEKTNLTFSEGLRSIVRQDPDIILVGEIRDGETAEIGVNAALTGHLLLSTFHSNDAATAIPRLLDMGIEPFLLSSTLELVIAQRLARRICSACKVGEKVSQTDLKKWLPNPKKYFSTKATTLYKGKGCAACNGTGFRGRVAIYEFIPVEDEMNELILKNPSTQTIWDLAKKLGAKSMFEDGIEKIKNGVTTLEEVLRVVSPK